MIISLLFLYIFTCINLRENSYFDVSLCGYFYRILLCSDLLTTLEELQVNDLRTADGVPDEHSKIFVYYMLCLGHCEVQHIEQSLGAFAKLRKAAVSFVVSVPLYVRLSVRKQQLDSNWTDFQEILYFRIFRKSVEKIRV